jgi:hypothetical protein
VNDHPVVGISPYTRFVWRVMDRLIEESTSDMDRNTDSITAALVAHGMTRFGIDWMATAIERARSQSHRG